MTPLLYLLYRSYRLISWATYFARRRFTVVGNAILGGICVALVTAGDMDSALAIKPSFRWRRC